MRYTELALSFVFALLGGFARFEFEAWMTRKERARQLQVLEEIRDALTKPKSVG